MPYHIEVDGYCESTAKKGKSAPLKKVSADIYDKYARYGLRIEDLYSEETLSQKLDIILPLKNKQLSEVYGLKTYTKKKFWNCAENTRIFSDLMSLLTGKNFSATQKKADKTVLFEGAQGIMLDIDYGTYPFVTSSSPIAGGACTGSGFGPKMVEEVIGVSKAYITRVGEGPFVTELKDETGDRIREIGREFGTTTGRRDAVVGSTQL